MRKGKFDDLWQSGPEVERLQQWIDVRSPSNAMKIVLSQKNSGECIRWHSAATDLQEAKYFPTSHTVTHAQYQPSSHNIANPEPNGCTSMSHHHQYRARNIQARQPRTTHGYAGTWSGPAIQTPVQWHMWHRMKGMQLVFPYLTAWCFFFFLPFTNTIHLEAQI